MAWSRRRDERVEAGVQALGGWPVRPARRHEGSITGLIGPNGSGKTTLFNLITGYERAAAGRDAASTASRSPARPPDRVFRLGVGRTFQITRLFVRLTVLRTCWWPPSGTRGGCAAWRGAPARRAERARALELLDFVGLARLAAEPAGNLSYGQRKLLELASLLVADPAVLLLDEPAGGVNPTLIEPARRAHPRAQPGRQDVPRRRAQHGVRDGAVRLR